MIGRVRLSVCLAKKKDLFFNFAAKFEVSVEAVAVVEHVLVLLVSMGAGARTVPYTNMHLVAEHI